MSKPLRVLVVEDSEDDALLVLRALQTGGFQTEHERVDTPEAMRAALADRSWDLVICDYAMPRFGGVAALALLRQSGRDLPFIVVSGTIGEEIAVGLMQAGAHDYLMKGHLARLAPAVERELREAEQRRERRQSEQKLRESEAVLRSFFDSAGGMRGIVEVVENDLLHVADNAVAAIFYGQTKESMRNRLDSELGVAKEVTRLWLAQCATAQRTGQPAAFDYVRPTAEGGQWLFATVSHLGTFTPGRPRFGYVVNDISERKRAEEALTLAHQRTTVLAQLGRELAEAITPKGAALSMLQAARQLMDWDASWFHLWNEEQQQFEHVVNFDLVDGKCCEVPPTRQTWRDISPVVRRVMQKGPQLVLRKDETDQINGLEVFGSPCRCLSLMFAPIRHAGQFIGILSTQSYQPQAYDPAALELLQTLADHCAGALARLQTASALRATRDRFRLIWEHSADGMCLTDGVGTVLMVNEAFCRLVRKPRAEIEGKPMCDIYAEANREQILARHRERFATRSVPVHFEQQVKLWDGRELWVEVANCLFELEPSKPVLFGLFRDITERRQQERLALRAQRLESIGTLAGGIAHDLNNTLAPIMMAGEMLRLEFPDAAASYLDIIQSSAKRGAAMVKQLLTFSKGAEGEHLPIQPRHLLKEMGKLINSTFLKSVELRTHFPKDLWTILGDTTQLHQVLLNLCVNAREAMPGGGTLTLEAENKVIDANSVSGLPEAKPGRYVVWRVTDTGTGIPPEAQDRIFDPFFTTKAPDKGTGLGLSTTLGIVKSHGGFIRVYSTPGQGSTFAVYLPAYGAGADDAALLTKADTDFRGHGETILVVDDEAAVRNVLRTVLTKLNFKVLTAGDGAAALTQVTEQQTELRGVITDLHMPHMDGLSFVRVLKARLPRAGIIVASGRLDEREENEFKALGVNALLEKPFIQEKLVAALRTVFQK